MKKLIPFLLMVMCFGLQAQIQNQYILVSNTDSAYTSQDSHFVARNLSVYNGKLLLFIGGTFSSPLQYEFFSKHAATLGYDVINISYLNSVLTTLLAGSSDSLSFDKFREEICFGTPISPAVTVDSLNSIYTRTFKLLQYLAQQYPSEHWQDYIIGNSLNWNKISVSGHSQGAGHAAYFSKQFAVERAVMFAGPNDYSTYFSTAAPWLRATWATPKFKQFVFLHLRDEIVPFNRQYENISGMGLLLNDDTTLVDNSTPHYGYSKCLYTNLNPSSGSQFHNSVIIGTATPLLPNNAPVFEPVWNYMLLSDVSTGLNTIEQSKSSFSIYPNPFSSTVCVEVKSLNSSDEYIELIDLAGRIMVTETMQNKKQYLDLSSLQSGMYFAKHKADVIRFIKY
jgi:hypothetical protein